VSRWKVLAMSFLVVVVGVVVVVVVVIVCLGGRSWL